MRDLVHNVWFITIAGGALAAILGTLVTRLFRRSTGHNKEYSQEQSQKIVITNNVSSGGRDDSAVNYSPNHPGSEDNVHFKATGKILFIDDLDLKSKILNLRNAGWAKVSQVQDAINLDQQAIIDAEVIFVDYKGIGPAKDHGLAVLSALRARYAKTKWLILYSAHPVPVDAFNRGADSYAVKNSSVYELEQKILEGLRSLRR